MAQFEASPHFSAREKLALRLAVAMARTPAQISDELYAELRSQFSERELVELSAVIAWEDARARFNRVFAIQSEGHSHGQFCPMPER
jgi:alkylhydroperoxidase family enzyme